MFEAAYVRLCTKHGCVQNNSLYVFSVDHAFCESLHSL